MAKISDRIKRDLSELILLKAQDPGLSGVFINDVRVDRELAYADIYVSTVEGHDMAKHVLESLDHASGFLRKELASRIELRTFPRLRFHWDPTPENAEHMEQLFREIKQQHSNQEKPDKK
jgi:ribosome-binding factor A